VYAIVALKTNNIIACHIMVFFAMMCAAMQNTCRYAVSTLARIGRIGPAFGIGGVANRSWREDGIGTMESFEQEAA
jgi:hypothetical protein